MICLIRYARASIASLCLALLSACGGSGGGPGALPPPASLTLQAAASVDAGTKLTIQPSGGTTPYTYKVTSGGGTIDGSSGVFTAPGTAGTTVIQATDAAGNTKQETLTINAPFVAITSQLEVDFGSTQSVTVGGGQGPFTYRVLSGGGSITASGVYSATTGAGTVIIQVTDALGTTVQVSLTIKSTIVVSPASATLTASSGEALQFTGQRGTPPYTYALTSGPGSLTPEGIYTVGSESGSATVQVTDANGATAVAKVHLLRIRVNGPVWTTVTDGTSVYVGGAFNAANPHSAPRLLLADPANGNPILGCDLGTGFLDGSVTAVLTSGNTIYVGGSFNLYNSTPVYKLARIDATTCAVDTNFSRAGGFGTDPGYSVTSLALSGGSLFVGGNFDSYRGTPARSVIKIDANTGDLDTTFNVGSGSDASGVSAVAVVGNAVYVGAGFRHFNGVPANYLAKLDITTGAVDTNFTNSSADDGGYIGRIQALGSTLYVAGAFKHYGGVATNLAKIDATSGAVDPKFSQNVPIYTSINDIVTGGSALYLARSAPEGDVQLAKMDAASGVVDFSFTSSASFDHGVYALAMFGSSLYVAGGFTTYQGFSATGLAKIDATTAALDTTFTHGAGTTGLISTIAMSGSVLVAGGGISTYGGQPVKNLAKFDVTTGLLDRTFADVQSKRNWRVNAMALNGGSLYVGGWFSSYQSAPVYSLAKVDTQTGLIDATFAQGGGAPFVVMALAVHGGSLYAAGGSGAPSGFISKVDLVTGAADPAFVANTNGPIYALAASDSALYAGGQFQYYGGSTSTTLAGVSNLAKVDLATGAIDQTFSQTLGAGSPGEWVASLLTNGSSLYVGGPFSNYRGLASAGLIKVDAITGTLDTVFANQPGPQAVVTYSLATDGTSLYAGGVFKPYYTNVIKYDLATGALDSTFFNGVPVSPASGATFSSLALVGREIYVGTGSAMLYRGAPSFFVFPLDSSTGAPLEP
jgi:hypothetical protein